jgi:hypothetical protein
MSFAIAMLVPGLRAVFSRVLYLPLAGNLLLVTTSDRTTGIVGVRLVSECAQVRFDTLCGLYRRAVKHWLVAID